MDKKYVATRHPHFVERVARRIGPDCDSEWLYKRIVHSIRYDDGWVRWKMRQRKTQRGQQDNRHIYYFSLNDERYYVVVAVAGADIRPVTILRPEFVLRKRSSKKPRQLHGQSVYRFHKGRRKCRR